MRKYTYSRTIGDQTFSAVEFDSFDEAKRIVDKAIYELKLAEPTTTPKQEANNELKRETRKEPELVVKLTGDEETGPVNGTPSTNTNLGGTS